MTPRQITLQDFPPVETPALRITARQVGDAEIDLPFFTLTVGLPATSESALAADELSFLRDLYGRRGYSLRCCSATDMTGCWTPSGHLAILAWACTGLAELQRLVTIINRLAGSELFTIDQRQHAIDSVNGDRGRAYHASVFALRYVGIPCGEQYELHRPLTPELRAQAIASGGHAAFKV